MWMSVPAIVVAHDAFCEMEFGVWEPAIIGIQSDYKFILYFKCLEMRFAVLLENGLVKDGQNEFDVTQHVCFHNAMSW